MFIPQNIDLLLLGISIASIAILAFVVFYNNPKGKINKSFIWLAVATIAWGIPNYVNYQLKDPTLILWTVRLTVFTAVYHAFAFYNFFRVFTNSGEKIKLWLKIWTIFVSLWSFTPFVYSGVDSVPEQGVANLHAEPGIALFGITSFGLIIFGLYKLLLHFKKSTGQERNQMWYIVLGSLVTFILILLFNLVLPAIFDDTKYIPLAPLFMLPFAVGTTYAIIKHRLLNVKVISTEFLAFGLTVAIFFEVLISDSALVLIFRGALFALVLILSILLIKSVVKEVHAREQIEKLKEQLEDANNELKKLDEAKSDFVSIASHQLRTPLTVIKGYMSMLSEGSFGKVPDKMKAPIDKAYKSSERLEDLVENLLSVSRIERGTMKYNFAEVDFIALAKSVVDELHPTAEAKKLQLKFDATNASLMVNIDQEKIRQVMVNLIDNSIKYTPAGSVTVRVSSQNADTMHRLSEPSVVFTVTDTGDGVALEIQKELFQKFVRGQNEIHIKGTGLGLYVGRMMVEAHHGQIWVNSEGEGKGATFGFVIPLAVPHTGPKK